MIARLFIREMATNIRVPSIVSRWKDAFRAQMTGVTAEKQTALEAQERIRPAVWTDLRVCWTTRCQS